MMVWHTSVTGAGVMVLVSGGDHDLMMVTVLVMIK